MDAKATLTNSKAWLPGRAWSAPGEPPPADPGELTFLRLSTRTPAVVEYAGQDVGKTAHYMVRWLNTRGEHGPWSETASATVGA